MSQILTYPYGVKYSSDESTYRGQVKDGQSGSLPINDEIHRGDYDQNTGGVSWVASSAGSDNVDSAQAYHYPFEQNSNGPGLWYNVQTSQNKSNWSRWFDLGADGGKQDGDVLAAKARSSFLSEVTGVWFLFNGINTTETRDCYARVEHVALRFVEGSSRKIRIRKVNEKIGYWDYMTGLRGNTKKIFGYQLDEAGRTEAAQKDFKLLGVRVQFQVRRGANGTHTDTIQGGMDGLRFSLGNATGTLTNSTKRALCGKGNTPWDEWSANWPKLQLEGRP